MRYVESDVIILPLKLLFKPLVHAVNICEWPFLRLPDVTLLCPTRFSCEVRSAEDCPDFAWAFYLRSIILQPCLLVANVVLEVPTVDEFLDLILKCDALLSGVIDILVVSVAFVLILLGAVSTQRVRLFEYPNLFRDHEDVLP